MTKKVRAKPKAADLRVLEVGYCYGPYTGVNMKVAKRIIGPRDATPRKIIALAADPGDRNWLTCAYRWRVFWEYRRKVTGGKDIRLVVRFPPKHGISTQEFYPVTLESNDDNDEY